MTTLSIKRTKGYFIEAVLNIPRKEVNREILEVYLEGGKVIFGEGNSKTFGDFPLKETVNYYISSLNTMVDGSGSAVGGGLTGCTTISTAANPAGGFRMHKLMQSLKYMSLVNIPLPKVVTQFTKNFDVTKTNILERVTEVDEESYGCNLPRKLR